MTLISIGKLSKSHSLLHLSSRPYLIWMLICLSLPNQCDAIGSQSHISITPQEKVKEGNEGVVAAVQRSKMAHYQWKCAGRPRDNSEPLRQKKEAKKSMRRVLRMTLYQQKQDFLTDVMSAKDSDVKLFHRLIKLQRTLPTTATQVLVYDGETLSGSGKIAAGFASHFQSLATPLTNNDFDADHYSQVEADVLVIEENCRRYRDP